MNYSNSFRTFWGLILLLGFAPSVQAMVAIDTRIGNGADSEIANDDPVFGAAYADDAQGGLGSMNTRFENSFAPIRHRASLMRFDITGVSGDLSGAGLTVHSVGQSRIVDIYALNDTSDVGIEDWVESTVTYNTAPGIINQGSAVVAGAVDPTRYTFLSTWRVPGFQSPTGPQNPVGEFEESFVSTTFPEPATDPDLTTVYTDPIDVDANFSTNLSNLVAADTNGLLTLLFFPVGDAQSQGNVALRTKEWETITDPNDPNGTIPNPAFVIAPTLVMPNAVIGGGGIPGDYDDDGFVGQSDLDLVLLNWGDTSPPAPTNWVNDVPDGLIGQGALDGVLLNWGNGTPPSIAAVPEPSTWMMLAIALAGGLVRRTATARRSESL